MIQMANELDFLNNLTAETTELPARAGGAGRGRKVKDNPFTPWVSESFAAKVGRSVTVPGASVKEAQYLIRSAAADLGLGVRVVVTDTKGNQLKPEDVTKLVENKSTRQVKVLFQGQEKRKYEKKATESTE